MLTEATSTQPGDEDDDDEDDDSEENETITEEQEPDGKQPKKPKYGFNWKNFTRLFRLL